MRVKFIGGLLVTGLLAVGCGGTEPAQEESTLNTRQDELPACGGMSYERVFYKEPEMINEVGWWYCDCGSSSAYIFGKTTAYSQYTYQNYCPSYP